MGAEFLQMMAAQLDAATALAVRFPQSGERLRHGQVIVAPATERIAIDEAGSVRFSAAPASPYNPSIDQLVRDAVDRFGDQVTLILFSGMGNDAVEGGRYLTERGGQVWAQDRSTCVIASMIEAAKSQGLIRFEGNPAQLAERVLQVLS
jgi:chemotaxis response regulator CheB